MKNPDDWWDGLGEAVRAAVQQAGVSTADIVSIGVDTTCCSVVALDANVSETVVLFFFRIRIFDFELNNENRANLSTTT